MRFDRARINLEEMSVREIRPRRVSTDALLLDIPGADGPDGARQADVLAVKMRETTR